MGKLSFGRVLDSLCLSSGSSAGCSSCFCINSFGSSSSSHDDDHFEKRPLMLGDNPKDGQQLVRLKDVISASAPPTLAFQLKPKVCLSTIIYII